MSLAYKTNEISKADIQVAEIASKERTLARQQDGGGCHTVQVGADHDMTLTVQKPVQVTSEDVFGSDSDHRSILSTAKSLTLSKTLGDWIGAHCRAFAFFGGVPRAVVPDNTKTGVSKACFYEPDLNPSYLEMAHHYGTAILPTRVRKPRDKANIETKPSARCLPAET